MRSECLNCNGDKVISIQTGWKSHEIWCPECSPDKFEAAGELYHNEVGESHAGLMMSLGRIQVARGKER